MMKGKRNGGFSLVEVVVAMAILGAIVLPVCGSMILAVKVNVKTEKLLKARIAVSSAVETLMAEGIQPGAANAYADRFENITISVTDADSRKPYYNVYVTYTDDEGYTLEPVETCIRAARSAAIPPAEEGGADE